MIRKLSPTLQKYSITPFYEAKQTFYYQPKGTAMVLLVSLFHLGKMYQNSISHVIVISLITRFATMGKLQLGVAIFDLFSAKTRNFRYRVLSIYTFLNFHIILRPTICVYMIIFAWRCIIINKTRRNPVLFLSNKTVFTKLSKKRKF